MQSLSRQAALKQIIAKTKTGHQKTLISAMKKKGFTVTQSMLSRDLQKIGAVKRDGAYVVGPLGQALDGAGQVLSIGFSPPNLVVVKTTPGLAPMAGLFIDLAIIPQIVGTVAGDDTIFVAIDSQSSHQKVTKALSQLFFRTRRRP